MRNIKIQKGWFRTAGAKYKWIPKCDILGVGVKMEDIQKHKALTLEIEGIEYYLDTFMAKNFIETFNSVYPMGELQIGIVSKSLLRKIGNQPETLSEPVTTTEETTPRNNTLFEK